jgi:hypothetical protein
MQRPYDHVFATSRSKLRYLLPVVLLRLYAVEPLRFSSQIKSELNKKSTFCNIRVIQVTDPFNKIDPEDFENI